MIIANIKSEKVRNILTGSATPASDLVSLMGEGKLTIDEKNEVLAYYLERGGLQTHATWEHNFCVEHSI